MMKKIPPAAPRPALPRPAPPWPGPAPGPGTCRAAAGHLPAAKFFEK